MPLDTWETNSAFEIGTLALRPSHHVSAIAHITNRSMTPDAAPSHPLAPKRPMTEGAQLRKSVGLHARRRCLSKGNSMSIGEKYKREHNTLVEAARIMLVESASVLLAVPTIPWRWLRGRKP